MPANLPPQYYEAEERYRLAKTNQEKLAILKKMWAIMPKHKGTDKLQGDLKAKISQLKKEIQKKKKTGKSTYSRHVDKQGAAQVVIIGSLNVGKSQLVASLTNATPEVAPYPFTTHEPLVGMMSFENIKIQLVDTPPITDEFIEPWLPEIIKYADYVILVVDLGSEEVLDQVDAVSKKLERSKIKKTMILGNKSDSEGAEERFQMLKELHGENFSIVSVSAKNLEGLEELKEKIYEELNIIRVYTKEPGKPADMMDPIVLKKRSILIDAARVIHKDFAYKLKYAKMWGSSKFSGQQVDRNHPLEDGDIVEFHL
ncbi:50S ribosome-binding GTPase [Candidatus Aerophobetes bacterium]|nr:50S ribosome-binding GTPase [Candidatus Aerophobetes bacterium]